MIHGFQFDANYTYSKSIDLSSDALRIARVRRRPWRRDHQRLGAEPVARSFRLRPASSIQYQLHRGYAIRARKGHRTRCEQTIECADRRLAVDRIVPHDQRFPGQHRERIRFPTNWELTGLANLTGHVDTGNGGHHAIIDGNGNPNISVFANGANAMSSFSPALPGFSGARNQVRGEGYRGLDLGLAKRWTMPWSDGQSLQFRWEVYNVTNTPIFNVQTAQINLYQGPTFGNYTSLLNQPRVMQFALRYEF